jgi:hypothetical protein
MEGGRGEVTERRSLELLAPAIRELSRRNPRSCRAAAAAHTPAAGAGTNPSSCFDGGATRGGRRRPAARGGEAGAAEGAMGGIDGGFVALWFGFGCAEHHASRERARQRHQSVHHRTLGRGEADAGLGLWGLGPGSGSVCDVWFGLECDLCECECGATVDLARGPPAICW